MYAAWSDTEDERVTGRRHRKSAGPCEQAPTDFRLSGSSPHASKRHWVTERKMAQRASDPAESKVRLERRPAPRRAEERPGREKRGPSWSDCP